MNWLSYHIGEESLISVSCFYLGVKAFRAYKANSGHLGKEEKSRIALMSSGFALMGMSSAIHAFIHLAGFDENLLYQTLLGYCLGFLVLIAAIAADNPQRFRLAPLLYLPTLFLLQPGLYSRFPLFAVFRPLAWVSIAYLAGLLFLLQIAVYYHSRAQRHLYTSLGWAFLCISSVILFFPAGIGSKMWIYGHLLRPLGFFMLLAGIRLEDFSGMKNSLLYKTLATFGLFSLAPLVFFSTVFFYANEEHVYFLDKRLTFFLLIAAMLGTALAFTLGLIFSLIKPIIRLKDSVNRLADEGFAGKIEVRKTDEIGELTKAFNEMVFKLDQSLRERDRLSRLAATGELAATLAHEIKNPLNSISGAASYIGENFKGSLINEFLKIINTEALRISKLSTALLNFAKPMNPDFQRCDLNRLAMETLTLLEVEFREKNVSLGTSFDKSLPAVRLDPGQIKQVLINLLINALDAVKQGGVIQVSTSASRGGVRLSVQDNGKGISGEIMKNIFNPFFTTKTRGAGIGLAVCKKIANEHGGDIFFESEEGMGSNFALCIPVKR
ncbi:MAG: ATP-binding protein [Nitrospiraceae bacterium]|nr:ATP-binding protein [Nitrospiraceae bacterium]